MAKDGKAKEPKKQKGAGKDKGKGKGPKRTAPSTVLRPVLIGAAALALLDAVLTKVL